MLTLSSLIASLRVDRALRVVPGVCAMTRTTTVHTHEAYAYLKGVLAVKGPVSGVEQTLGLLRANAPPQVPGAAG